MYISPMKNRLTPFLILIIVISCNPNKEEKQLTNGFFETNQEQYFYLPEMYTAAGKITDTAIIYDYLRKLSNHSLNINNQDFVAMFSSQPRARKFEDTIRITIAGNDATIYKRLYFSPSTDPANPRNYQLSNAQMIATNASEVLLQYTDSSSVIFSNGVDANFGEKSRKMSHYNPPLNCRNIWGGSSICSYKDFLPVKVVNNNEIRVLSYTNLLIEGSLWRLSVSSQLFNRPNENMSAFLEKLDTVIVQQNEIILRRK